jgi:glutaconate CoA-transferase, subunit B
MTWTAEEMMAVSAARTLRGRTSCFVGIGLPSRAANLAARTGSPDLVLIYESGTLGTRPRRLPLSIGDGELAETAQSVVSVPEVFNYWLQPGRIDVGFLGAAQLDRHARINTTVIGPSYRHPAVRLPGAGGAPEIAAACREVVVVLRHDRRALVERVDFVTSVCRGPVLVVTDLGVLEPDPDTRELILTRVHPGVDVPAVRAATGWPLAVAEPLPTSDAPTDEELSVLRHLVSTERAGEGGHDAR